MHHIVKSWLFHGCKLWYIALGENACMWARNWLLPICCQGPLFCPPGFKRGREELKLRKLYKHVSKIELNLFCDGIDVGGENMDLNKFFLMKMAKGLTMLKHGWAMAMMPSHPSIADGWRGKWTVWRVHCWRCWYGGRKNEWGMHGRKIGWSLRWHCKVHFAHSTANRPTGKTWLKAAIQAFANQIE